MSISRRNFSAAHFAERHGSTSSTEGGRGRTTAGGRGCHDLLNMLFFTKENTENMRERLEHFAMLFSAKRHGTSSSTHGGRGRTNANGRELHDLLNRNLNFSAFTKGRVPGEQLAWLFFTFKNSNSGNTGALARTGM